MTAGQEDLFALDATPAARRRPGDRRAALRAFKERNGILTHDAGRDFDPAESRWLAVKVPPRRLDDGGPIAGMSVGEMMACFCRLLDEGGWTGNGPTQLEAVKACAEARKIPFDL